MANPEHLEIFKKGANKWNAWRKENPSVKPDLCNLDLTALLPEETNLVWSKFNLAEANLSNVNFDKAELQYYWLKDAVLVNASLKNASLHKADLMNANLLKADLSNANLTEADLSDANLSNANLSNVNLSGAIISEKTKYSLIKGVEIGINGIWCKATDSAALMTFIPPGNSMLGNNPNAIIESLRHARRMFGSSLMLAGIILLIFFLQWPTIKIPSIEEKIPAQKFGLVAIPLSLMFLALAKAFLNDAFKGSHYLQDRNGAMTVGNFPWIVSKYSGDNAISKMESLVLRVLLTLHPLVYIIFREEIGLVNVSLSVKWIFGILICVIMFFSTSIFIVSQKLQKPILFDAETERKRVDDIGRIVSAINDQTASIKELKNAVDNK